MADIRIPGPMGPPTQTPIGILVARAGRAVDKAFDEALAGAGGTRSTWLVLLAVKSGAGGTQAALARHVGISGPTLMHHLDRLETDGHVTRTRDPANRRPYTIVLTTSGEELFLRLRGAAIEFDRRLRAGISEDAIAGLRTVLTAMCGNLADTDTDTPALSGPERRAP